jgi:CheY-like chemotaxis protein
VTTGCVLLVDDEPDVLEVIQTILELSGYAVLTATSGREALDLVRANDRVGLVMVDLMMPGTDGWWLRDRVAEDPALADLPIVVLSGAGLTAAQSQALASSTVLKKPVELHVLLATVERTMRRRS